MTALQRARSVTEQYRRIEMLRGAWGLALIAVPDPVLGAVHRLRIDTKSRAVARILGARHLTQAILSGYRPSPEVLAMGVWVDAIHALAALGLAAIDRRRIRAGLADTAIAAVWAAAGYRDLTIARATPARHQHVRDQLADVVLARVPAGSFLRQKVDDARHR